MKKGGVQQVKILLNQLTCLLDSDLDEIAVKVYEENENGEVFKDDTAVQYGLLTIEPYLNTFSYKAISGKQNDFRKIANARVLSIDRPEYLMPLSSKELEKDAIKEEQANFDLFNDALIMVSIAINKD